MSPHDVHRPTGALRQRGGRRRQWERDVRHHLRALAQRRTDLGLRPQLTPEEGRELGALTWVLRLLRHVYPSAELGSFLHDLDLDYPRRSQRPQARGDVKEERPPEPGAAVDELGPPPGAEARYDTTDR